MQHSPLHCAGSADGQRPLKAQLGRNRNGRSSAAAHRSLPPGPKGYGDGAAPVGHAKAQVVGEYRGQEVERDKAESVEKDTETRRAQQNGGGK